MAGPVTILGFMTARPGTEQILIAAVDDVVTKTRAEGGCLNYDFHQHRSHPTRFVFYENFADQAAFELHFAQPYTRAWIELAESYGAVFDVQFWRMLTEPA
jgi:quinol monooxygenase YgiN